MIRLEGRMDGGMGGRRLEICSNACSLIRFLHKRKLKLEKHAARPMQTTKQTTDNQFMRSHDTHITADCSLPNNASVSDDWLVVAISNILLPCNKVDVNNYTRCSNRSIQHNTRIVTDRRVALNSVDILTAWANTKAILFNWINATHGWCYRPINRTETCCGWPR